MPEVPKFAFIELPGYVITVVQARVADGFICARLNSEKKEGNASYGTTRHAVGPDYDDASWD